MAIEKQSIIEIQRLIDERARIIAQQVYDEKGTQYGVPSTPYHTHNGIDAPEISEDNVILTNKLNTQLLVSNPTGSPDTDTFTLKNVNKISRISFHGFTANNASGPATQRAVITGEVIFGICKVFTGTGPSIVITTIEPGTPFVQCSNAMFTDTAALANIRVSTAPNLALAVDSTGTVITSLTLDSYDGNSLTFTVVLGAQFQLQGNIIIE